MFKVNNKDTRPTFKVSIIDFKQVIVCCIKLVQQKKLSGDGRRLFIHNRGNCPAPWCSPKDSKNGSETENSSIYSNAQIKKISFKRYWKNEKNLLRRVKFQSKLRPINTISEKLQFTLNNVCCNKIHNQHCTKYARIQENAG